MGLVKIGERGGVPVERLVLERADIAHESVVSAIAPRVMVVGLEERAERERLERLADEAGMVHQITHHRNLVFYLNPSEPPGPPLCFTIPPWMPQDGQTHLDMLECSTVSPKGARCTVWCRNDGGRFDARPVPYPWCKQRGTTALFRLAANFGLRFAAIQAFRREGWVEVHGEEIRPRWFEDQNRLELHSVEQWVLRGSTNTTTHRELPPLAGPADLAAFSDAVRAAICRTFVERPTKPAYAITPQGN